MQEVTLGIQRSKPVEVRPVDLSVEYGLSSDFNREEQPREFRHRLGLGVSRKFFSDYTATLSGGVQYTTLDADVVRTNEKDSYFKWSDIGLAVMRTFRTQDMRHSLTGIVSGDALVSDESRYLGYRSVLSAQAVHNWSVHPKVMIKSSVGFGHYWNRFRYSPVDMGGIRRGDIMADASYAYGVGPIITLYKGLRLGATLSVRGTRYLDNTHLFDFGNSYSLTYARSNWSAYLRYLNRGYSERGETNLWFVDQYRRLASAGLIYNF